MPGHDRHTKIIGRRAAALPPAPYTEVEVLPVWEAPRVRAGSGDVWDEHRAAVTYGS